MDFLKYIYNFLFTENSYAYYILLSFISFLIFYFGLWKHLLKPKKTKKEEFLGLEKIPQWFTDGIDEIIDGLETIVMSVYNPINDFVNENIADPIMSVIDGIDDMIENFIRIVCFLNKSGSRFRNLSSSFENIFEGVIEEFIAMGYALELGFTSISSLVYHVSLFIESYINCGVKFFSNLISCLPFYLLDILGFILYLPITIFLWIFSTFLGMDFYAREKQAWEGINMLSYTLFPYLGFHLVHYPQHIRENCYSCVRLKSNVINKKADEVDTTFTEDIPQVLRNASHKLQRGANQFNEVFAYPHVREPEDVH